MAKPLSRKKAKQDVSNLPQGEADVKEIERTALEELAAAKEGADIEAIRLKYLGRKGVLPLALRGLKDMDDAQKRLLGPALNTARKSLEQKIEEQSVAMKQADLEILADGEAIDVTEPVPKRPLGHLHPTEQVRREIEDMFRSMGFEIVRGQEIDDEENNFDLLNIPADHPARDLWDTFWLKQAAKVDDSVAPGGSKKMLLRTHTSNMQVRTMRERKPPFRIVNIGRVYRFEATDKSHENTFHQVEGFIIDESTTMGDLRGVLRTFFETIFGQKLETRFRPSYFPFTEPSVELDISCTFCSGSGKNCSVCRGSGWLEVAGAGMIHPTVLKNGGFNPTKYQGFAFGMGLDRITMLKYGIDDIRLLLSGDLRFLEQF